MSSTDRNNAADDKEGVMLLPEPAPIATPANGSEAPSQSASTQPAVAAAPGEEAAAGVPRNQSGSIPLIRPRDGDATEPPPHPVDGEALPNIWIYDGEAYDLTPFIAKHPADSFLSAGLRTEISRRSSISFILIQRKSKKSSKNIL